MNVAQRRELCSGLLLHYFMSSVCQAWRAGSTAASPTPLSCALECGAGLVLLNLFINDLLRGEKSM